MLFKSLQNYCVEAAIKDMEDKFFWKKIYCLLCALFSALKALRHCNSTILAMDNIYFLVKQMKHCLIHRRVLMIRICLDHWGGDFIWLQARTGSSCLWTKYRMEWWVIKVWPILFEICFHSSLKFCFLFSDNDEWWRWQIHSWRCSLFCLVQSKKIGAFIYSCSMGSLSWTRYSSWLHGTSQYSQWQPQGVYGWCGFNALLPSKSQQKWWMKELMRLLIFLESILALHLQIFPLQISIRLLWKQQCPLW